MARRSQTKICLGSLPCCILASHSVRTSVQMSWRRWQLPSTRLVRSLSNVSAPQASNNCISLCNLLICLPCLAMSTGTWNSRLTTGLKFFCSRVSCYLHQAGGVKKQSDWIFLLLFFVAQIATRALPIYADNEYSENQAEFSCFWFQVSWQERRFNLSSSLLIQIGTP